MVFLYIFILGLDYNQQQPKTNRRYQYLIQAAHMFLTESGLPMARMQNRLRRFAILRQHL
jgi:hypothetical protein